MQKAVRLSGWSSVAGRRCRFLAASDAHGPGAMYVRGHVEMSRHAYACLLLRINALNVQLYTP